MLIHFCLVKTEDPSQASKFSQEAFDAIRDIAIGTCVSLFSAHMDLTIAKKKKAQEFHAQVYDSPFRQQLCKYAHSFDTLEHNKPDFLPQVAFMDPAKIQPLRTHLTAHWGDASTIIKHCSQSWVLTTWSLNMMETFPFPLIT